MADNRSQAPFPRRAYVLGWLVVALVLVMGIKSLVDGVYGTGIIFVCLVPLMVWLMYTRRHRGRPAPPPNVNRK